jgi:hypothetical protein
MLLYVWGKSPQYPFDWRLDDPRAGLDVALVSGWNQILAVQHAFTDFTD